MDEEEITKEELAKYINNLDEDAKVIVCKKSEDIPKIFKTTGEKIKTGKHLFLFLRNLGGAVVAVWVAALALAPEWTPTMPEVVKITADKAPELIAQIDFSFPYDEDPKHPYYRIDGVLPSGQMDSLSAYDVPSTGIHPDLLS
jgi:hypothetical protein